MNPTNNSKEIVYCTQVYFLDTAIEYIRLLTESDYTVHVLIELSPNQLRANILNIDTDLNTFPPLTAFKDVEKSWNLEYLSPYFQKCSTVNFTVFPSKSLGMTWRVAQKVRKHIKNINPDFIHLDDFSSRTLFNLPYFFFIRKKLVANIHDPLTHSGEYEWQRELYRKVLFNLIPEFVVFSEFSRSILRPQLRKRKKIVVLKLMPYTVYRSFLKLDRVDSNGPKEFISFVGRISPYKGVELFIGALDNVLEIHSNVQFYVGGQSKPGYSPEFLTIKRKNLIVENRFLSNTELAAIINRSKLIVCPYKDATQSGVIMTAYALGCPVLVTNTGGLPEYVLHNKTGMIANDTSQNSIANSIIEFLKNDKYLEMSKNLTSESLQEKWISENLTGINELYG